MPSSANLDTSNETLNAEAVNLSNRMNYSVVAQSVDDLRDAANSPSISMGPYLISTNQTRLLTILSIYSTRGNSREQVRILYMNETALRLWKEMGKRIVILGVRHRPPHEALLNYGVPFSE